jgi:hypothetical protein
MTVTQFGGKKYFHKDYTTAAKQKNLPEAVKKAIQGEKYVEPTATVQEVVEPQSEPTQE